MNNIFPTMICDSSSSYCIDYNNNLWVFGNKIKLSDDSSFLPQQIKSLVNIKMMSCTDSNVSCINYDGDVYTIGINYKGQLGIGKEKSEFSKSYIPQKVDLPYINHIDCGYNFTACLSDNNLLYSFGGNDYGQLGNGNTRYSISPILVPNLTDIEFFTCGRARTICKTLNNEYYGWGYGCYGEIGNGKRTTANTPIKLLNWPDIISIKCGKFHTLLLTSDGLVYSCGINNYGQLGLDLKSNCIFTLSLIESLPKIQKISCGAQFSMCVDYENSLWVFGLNSNGQLGLNDTNHRYKPVKNNNIEDIIDLSSKGYHILVKTSSYKIYGFGDNRNSQLGKKTQKYNQVIPLEVLEDHNDIWCTKIGKSTQKSARK